MTAAVVVTTLGLVGSAGSANSNALAVVLDGYPGPGQVTYGKNVASTLSVQNVGNNPWNKVVVRFPAPSNGTETATLAYAPVCPVGTGSEALGQQADVVCNLGTMAPDQSYTFLVVWKTWSSGSSGDCGPDVSSCFKTSVRVTGNEGTSGPDANPSSHDDTFDGGGPIVTPLLDSPGTDKEKAGAYALSACTAGTTPATLATNPNLDKDANPLQTIVCAPNLIGATTNPGLPVFITEGPKGSAPGKTQLSTICIPAPPQKCESGYTPFTFTGYATFTLVVSNRSFTGKITKVFYDPDDDGPAPFAELPLYAPAVTGGPYVESITPDNSAQTTTIVVKTRNNGRFIGG